MAKENLEIPEMPESGKTNVFIQWVVRALMVIIAWFLSEIRTEIKEFSAQLDKIIVLQTEAAKDIDYLKANDAKQDAKIDYLEKQKQKQ